MKTNIPAARRSAEGLADRPGRATIETISKVVGVSPSTVSRALKGDTRISDRRRNAIVAAAEDLGYFPNANARSLATRRSGLIGLVTGDFSNPFFSELLTEMVRKTSERGQRLMMLHMGAEAPSEATIEALLSYQMDGCIISSATLSSRAAEICHKHSVPLVMINRVPRLHGSAVSCNNFDGSRLLVRLLVATGHRRIAVIAGTPNASTSEDRIGGALAALAEAGLGALDHKKGPSSYERGFVAATELMTAPVRPDAIFAVNDITAMGVVDAVRQLGFDVPGDVSVTGFDDIRDAARPSYALTTIAQPVGAMVQRALDILDLRMRDPHGAGEQSYIEGDLIVRKSVALGEGFDLTRFLSSLEG